jgi:hypothetical protein
MLEGINNGVGIGLLAGRQIVNLQFDPIHSLAQLTKTAIIRTVPLVETRDDILKLGIKRALISVQMSLHLAWTMPLPPQGIYHGKGVGPTAWLIISSNLLDIMRQLRFGTFFKAAISGDTLRIAGFSYVDDTDLTQSTTPMATTAEEVLEKIQEGLNTWEGLVRASGGALSNDKSCWWFIDFTFDHKGDWRYKTMEELEGELTAVDIDGT